MRSLSSFVTASCRRGLSRAWATAGLLAACILAAGAAQAGDAVRLGSDVVPTFETVELRLDADASDYTGEVRIDLRVQRPVDAFLLHAERLEVTAARLTRGTEAIAVRTEPDGDDRLRVIATGVLDPGAYRLELEFHNTFGTKAVGLYRMEQGDQGYLFTQFEADDAREAFPCFDEPGFKIPWQLTLEVPVGDDAITNTPEETTSEANGWRRLVFRKSPPMPSYLVAIAAGPLVKVPIPGLRVPGNVVVFAGQEKLARMAIETTTPILEALEAYFDQRYPYEKLDLVAIPEYWPGAMENPGAVTYAASILLIDPEAASVAQQRTLVRVTAHELAHMWFGDLVTMAWWDDLWLNESFADWMGDKIAHRVFPQYNLDVTELRSVLNVMNGDARPSAQAIRRPIESTDNLMENIGAAYNKGKAVLAMFEQWLGEETFRKGVLRYIEKHAWKNATAADLWEALDAASGQEVAAAMATFIEQPGVPLVQVEPAGGNTVLLRQRRFANYGVEQPAALQWRIPVTLRYGDGDRSHTKTVLLERAEQRVRLDTGGAPAWVLPNADQRGYYRWEVPQDMLADLARNAPRRLNERERVGFLGNLSALLDAGRVSGGDYLYALGEFASDPQPMVIAALMDNLGKVEMAFVPRELQDSFAAYVRRTLRPTLDRIGMTPKTGEPEDVALVRPRLLRWLGDRGRDPEVLEWASHQAAAYLEDPKRVDASLASTVLGLAAIRGDRALFDTYRERFEAAQIPADRNRYLAALSSFRDPEIVDAALAYTLEGPLRPNELFRIPGGLMGDPEGRDHVFQWFTEHYDDIAQRIPPFMLGFMPFIASGCSAQRLEAARQFFTQPEHQVPGTETQLAKVTDQVQDCVGLREREGAAVAAFLNQNVGAR